MHATTLQLEVRDTGFAVTFRDLTFEVPHGRLERVASDLALLCEATRGDLTSGLREHLTEHFRRDQAPSPRCEFCKLQGRILAAEGRRRLTEREQRDRAKGFGAVAPTQLREGASGAALERALRAADLREAERLRKLPRLNGARSGDTTAWF